MNSVGLDVHKTRCVACVKTQEGRILEEFAFQNNPHGHEELVMHLKGYPEVQVAIESTGNLWIPIYDRLEDVTSCMERTVNVIEGIILKKV